MLPVPGVQVIEERNKRVFERQQTACHGRKGDENPLVFKGTASKVHPINLMKFVSTDIGAIGPKKMTDELIQMINPLV